MRGHASMTIQNKQTKQCRCIQRPEGRYIALINAREYEEIDINALAENTAAKGVTATHNDMIAKILLDSGAIGRSFITTEYCNLNRLVLKNLPYKIKIKSIHGDEIATEGIELQDLEVNALGQSDHPKNTIDETQRGTRRYNNWLGNSTL